MLNKLGLVLCVLVLSACTVVRGNNPMQHSAIDKQMDLSLINENEATIIVYHHQGDGDVFPVFVDMKQIGIATAEQPVRFSVPAGEHSLHATGEFAVDRITKQAFKVGEVYYFKLWIDMGMWTSSIRLTSTRAITDY